MKVFSSSSGPTIRVKIWESNPLVSTVRTETSTVAGNIHPAFIIGLDSLLLDVSTVLDEPVPLDGRVDFVMIKLGFQCCWQFML